MNRIRNRLFLAFFVVMLLALALPILYGRQRMHADVLEDMRAATLREARITAELLQARPDINAALLQNFLGDLAAANNIRLTFVTEDGRVLADSDANAAALASHTDRPEIAEALHNGSGWAIRYSATLKMEQIYAAASVQAAPNRPAGVIRVAVPFAGIAGRVDGLAIRLGLGSLLVAGLAFFLSRNMLRRLEQSIKDMTRVVEYTAPETQAGTPHPRPSLPPRQEFHTLSVAVSAMADRVEKQIQTIAAQKMELASILDSMDEGVLVLDKKGRIRRVNPALSRLFPELVHAEGRLPGEVVPIARLQQAIGELLADPEPRSLSLNLEYDRDRTLSVQLTRLASNRNGVSAVIVLHDISDMARLVRMRRDLIANVSHELRTPLTAIQGYADTLLTVDEDTQTRQKFINIIRKHTAHMSRLIEDLLTISRLENGEGISPGCICRPAEALAEAQEECLPQAEARNVHFVSALPAELCVYGDKDRVGQIFRNLLENAVRYAEPGTPVLVKGEAVLQENGQADTLMVTVQDFGPGIPEAELERIFERFHRVETHRGGGSGLGLSICKHILERLGGHIEAVYAAPPLTPQLASLPDVPVGATLRFTLPLASCISDDGHDDGNAAQTATEVAR